MATTTPSTSPLPPLQSTRWFPGYTVAGVSAVALIATAPGQTFLVAQLNGPLSQDIGLTPLALNGAYTVATMAAALPLAFIGTVADRLGPRRTLALVAGAFALGCAAMGSAHGLLGVFLGFFLIRCLGQGALSLVAQHALAMWFHRRLGSIQGIKTVVLFAAWVPLPPLTAAMIAGIGWRATYWLFAIAVALSVIPLALRFIRDRPEELGLRMDNDPPERAGDAPTAIAEELPEATGAGPYPGPLDETREPVAPPDPTPPRDFTMREASRTSAFWIVTVAFFLSPLVGTALLFDMQPMLDSNGRSGVAAATPISVWTATMALMALPAGFLTDRWRAATLVSSGMALIAIAPLLMWMRMDLSGACAAMIVFGVGQSLVGASGTAAIARFFGRSHHGVIRGSMARIGVFGTGFGPLATGLSLRLTDGYGAALLTLFLLCVPVAIAAIRLAAPLPPPRALRRPGE